MYSPLHSLNISSSDNTVRRGREGGGKGDWEKMGYNVTVYVGDEAQFACNKFSKQGTVHVEESQEVDQ